MPQTNFTPILIYKSDTASAVPSAGNLTNSANGAELAVNTADKRLFTKDSGGSVVEIGTNPSSLTLPNGTANGIVFANGSKVLTTGSALTFDGTNLGLGVTPSAWGSNFKALQVNDTGASLWSYRSGATSNEYLYLSNNSYNNNTNDIYIRDGAAVQYRQLDGTHAWFNAPSGTAGNTATMTQAMTLDASGNLGVGTTSPNTRLEVLGGTNNAEYLRAGSPVSDRALRFSSFAVNGTNNIGHLINAPGFSGTDGTLAFATNSTERARIDSSGNFGIGTSSPDPFSWGTSIGINNASYSALSLKVGDVGKAYVAAGSGAMYIGGPVPVLFYTGSSGNGTERARIDSSGNLLVGTTSYVGSGGSAGVQVFNSSGTAGRINLGKSASGTLDAIANYHSGTYVGGISYSNTATALVASSDERLKKNIAPASSALEKVNSIDVVSYDWKHDPTHVEFGFVAQQLNTVYPEAVKQGDVGENIEQTWGVEYGRMTPLLIKAIQEQQAIIETLTARVAALESK